MSPLCVAEHVTREPMVDHLIPFDATSSPRSSGVARRCNRRIFFHAAMTILCCSPETLRASGTGVHFWFQMSYASCAFILSAVPRMSYRGGPSGAGCLGILDHHGKAKRGRGGIVETSSFALCPLPLLPFCSFALWPFCVAASGVQASP